MSPSRVRDSDFETAADDEPEPYSRRSFYFSLGIGCSVTGILCIADTGNGFFPAFATKFQIGAAVSDTTFVHWTSRVEWKTYVNEEFDINTGEFETNTEIHSWGVSTRSASAPRTTATITRRPHRSSLR